MPLIGVLWRWGVPSEAPPPENPCTPSSFDTALVGVNRTILSVFGESCEFRDPDSIIATADLLVIFSETEKAERPWNQGELRGRYSLGFLLAEDLPVEDPEGYQIANGEDLYSIVSATTDGGGGVRLELKRIASGAGLPVTESLFSPALDRANQAMLSRFGQVCLFHDPTGSLDDTEVRLVLSEMAPKERPHNQGATRGQYSTAWARLSDLPVTNPEGYQFAICADLYSVKKATADGGGGVEMKLQKVRA